MINILSLGTKTVQSYYFKGRQIMVVTCCHLEFYSTWSFAPFHGYSSFAFYMFKLEPFFPFPGVGVSLYKLCDSQVPILLLECCDYRCMQPLTQFACHLFQEVREWFSLSSLWTNLDVTFGFVYVTEKYWR